MCKVFVEGSDELFDFGGSRAVSKLGTFGAGLGEMTSVASNGFFRARQLSNLTYSTLRFTASSHSVYLNILRLCVRAILVNIHEPVNV